MVDTTSILVENAFTSEIKDRAGSTLAPAKPAAAEMEMSANPLMNTSETVITADRSLPSHSTENAAMMESLELASIAF